MFCRSVQSGSQVSPPGSAQRQQRRELGDAQHGLFDLTGAHAQEDRVAQTGVNAVERASADGGEAVMQGARIRAGRFQQNIGDARAGSLDAAAASQPPGPAPETTSGTPSRAANRA